ncbi:hypothetical protein D3C87_1397500 [compost metagenome]
MLSLFQNADAGFLRRDWLKDDLRLLNSLRINVKCRLNRLLRCGHICGYCLHLREVSGNGTRRYRRARRGWNSFGFERCDTLFLMPGLHVMDNQISVIPFKPVVRIEEQVSAFWMPGYPVEMIDQPVMLLFG